MIPTSTGEDDLLYSIYWVKCKSLPRVSSWNNVYQLSWDLLAQFKLTHKINHYHIISLSSGQESICSFRLLAKFIWLYDISLQLYIRALTYWLLARGCCLLCDPLHRQFIGWLFASSGRRKKLFPEGRENNSVKLTVHE